MAEKVPVAASVIVKTFTVFVRSHFREWNQ